MRNTCLSDDFHDDVLLRILSLSLSLSHSHKHTRPHSQTHSFSNTHTLSLSPSFLTLPTKHSQALPLFFRLSNKYSWRVCLSLILFRKKIQFFAPSESFTLFFEILIRIFKLIHFWSEALSPVEGSAIKIHGTIL